jgi:LysM repeat protein
MSIRMRNFFSIAVALSLAALMQGCVTDEIANKEDVQLVRTQVNEKVIGMEDRLNALEGRTDAVEKRLDDMQKQLSEIDESFSSRLSQQMTQSQDELKKAREEMTSEMSKKMGIVIEEVVKENQKIADKLNAMQRGRTTVSSDSGTPGGNGTYHTVETGQSLSKIASLYGVTVEEIMKANEMDDPNKLKIGQKLFIPQR